MKIPEIGGEFALIGRIAARFAARVAKRAAEGARPDETPADPAVVRGIGDDCAVLDPGGDRYLLVTTDMLVEEVHFSLSAHTPYQVGLKLAESNVSDVLAMGGAPRWAFLACSLRPDTSVEFADALVDGLADSFRRHGVQLLGGDTTRGAVHALTLTLIGEVERGLLRLRSTAEPGDLLCATGTLGGNAAGLALFQRGLEGERGKFLEPRARTAPEARAVARRAHAMIDVSDGLVSEVGHLCAQSGVAAEIELEKVPLSAATRETARRLGLDPLDFALYGGEDFELVFALPPRELAALKAEFDDFAVIGRILAAGKAAPGSPVRLLQGGKPREDRRPGSGGWDHFG